jgi:hypothetical protein
MDRGMVVQGAGGTVDTGSHIVSFLGLDCRAS